MAMASCAGFRGFECCWWSVLKAFPLLVVGMEADTTPKQEKQYSDTQLYLCSWGEARRDGGREGV